MFTHRAGNNSTKWWLRYGASASSRAGTVRLVAGQSGGDRGADVVVEGGNTASDQEGGSVVLRSGASSGAK